MSEVFSTAVYREFGGRDQRFELLLSGVRELERLCSAGIGEIWKRVISGTFRLDDLRQTIKLGLIGGGVAPVEAEAIIRFSVDGRPVNEYFELVYDILKAFMDGVEPIKKASGAEPSGVPETSAHSTSSGAPPDLAQEKSMQ